MARPAFCALSLALVVCASAGAAAAAESFKSEYDKGATAFAAGDYAGALSHFERAYAIKPHPLCLFGIGQSHRKLEHVDEAIAAYERFLATKPAPDLAGETAGYLAELRKAKVARVDTDEARRLFSAGDYIGAALRYGRAYEVHPEPSLLYSIGLSYEKAGNKAKAIELYERFLKSDTDPRLRSEAEAALRALRAEPDPAGKSGPPDGGSPESSGALGAGERVDDPEPPGGHSRVGLYAALGGGAAAVVAVVVVIVVVVAHGSGSDASFGGMNASF
jgi:tetratricopeptide (TPR) repeat protein